MRTIIVAALTIATSACKPIDSAPHVVTSASSSASSGTGGAGGEDGSGGASASSSTGMPVECVGDDDCPGPLHSPCAWPTCRSGVCSLRFAPDSQWPEEATKKGDCLAYRCDGAGNVIQSVNMDDPPEPTECTVTGCLPGPVVYPKEDGSTCSTGTCKAGLCTD